MSTKFLFNALSGNFDAVTVVTATTVGSTPNANAVTIGSDGATLTLQPANASFPGVVTTGAQSFAGNKTFTNSILGNTIDTPSTGGTMAIGTANATTINIGNVGATVNIQGTVITEQSTTLNVTNPVFTVNSGGGAGSASNSGMQVNENNVITGYVETSADRNSWILKAPNTAGIVTLTPGAGGITLAGNVSGNNTGDVTLGTANGLSLSGQVLSLGLASTSTTGALSNTDWNTFNNKASAGNYITSLTGDVSASGPGSATVTLSTVNSNVGSFGSATQVPVLTVNAKGLITAVSNAAIQISESQVTNLVSDLAGKQATGNYITTLTGDATASGPGSAALTLATVNSNVGTFTNATITVNSKGLITAASNGSSGGITSVSVASANGLAGTSSGGTTPTLTLSTTITGLLKGNGTAISAASANTDYVAPVTGDIVPTVFTGANNTTTPTNVTGLAFANATVGGFTAYVKIALIATTSLYEYVEIKGVQKGSSWEIAPTSTGDTSGVLFSITNAGQIQYTSPNASGFTSLTMKFRALAVAE